MARQLYQRTLGDYAENDDEADDDWPPYDEYGPTADRPLPPGQQPAWVRRLQYRGVCPTCWAERESHRRGDEWHVDDVRPTARQAQAMATKHTTADTPGERPAYPVAPKGEHT